jgi:hypothetical protein
MAKRLLISWQEGYEEYNQEGGKVPEELDGCFSIFWAIMSFLTKQGTSFAICIG